MEAIISNITSSWASISTQTVHSDPHDHLPGYSTKMELYVQLKLKHANKISTYLNLTLRNIIKIKLILISKQDVLFMIIAQ